MLYALNLPARRGVASIYVCQRGWFYFGERCGSMATMKSLAYFPGLSSPYLWYQSQPQQRPRTPGMASYPSVPFKFAPAKRWYPRAPNCQGYKHPSWWVQPTLYGGTPVSHSSRQAEIMARPKPSSRISNTVRLTGTVITGSGGQRDKLLNPLIINNNTCP